MKFLIFLFSLFVTQLAIAQSYPMYCKGGFTYKVSIPQILVTFKKSTVRAMNEGANLKSGTCAWGDRPINSAEPTVILLPSSGDFTYPLAMGHQMFQSCSIHKKCVIRANVKNTGSVFEIDPSNPDIRTTEL